MVACPVAFGPVEGSKSWEEHMQKKLLTSGLLGSKRESQDEARSQNLFQGHALMTNAPLVTLLHWRSSF
jgi:hypothetical protein